MNEATFKSHHIYIIFGAGIATLILVAELHIFFIFDAETLSNTTWQLLFWMFLLMIPSLMIGYMLGIIPTLITNHVFFKLMSKYSVNHITLATVIRNALLAGMIWLPFCFVFIINGINDNVISDIVEALSFVFLVVIPTSVLCGYWEWRRNIKDWQQARAIPS